VELLNLTLARVKIGAFLSYHYTPVIQGRVGSLMGPLAVYKIIVYNFQKGKEKRFVIEDHRGVGVFEIFSGICK
jgi:hypothetical protein